MRLWHKSLIGVLPRQQLLGQWRECCAIAKSLSQKGTPNHILVNKILDYPIEHFRIYARLVYLTARVRGYNVEWSSFTKYLDLGPLDDIPYGAIFFDWHNRKYLKQCLFNLQEKFDCGGISETEWLRIYSKYKTILEE